MSRRSVKSFYGNRISYHRFMQRAIDETVADDENSSADIILIESPAAGYETDNKEEDGEDEDALAETDFPKEVSSEMVVIHSNLSDNEEENDSNQASSSGSQSKTLIDHGEVDDFSSGISDEEADYIIRKWKKKNELKRKQTAKKKDDPQTKKKANFYYNQHKK